MNIIDTPNRVPYRLQQTPQTPLRRAGWQATLLPHDGEPIECEWAEKIADALAHADAKAKSVFGPRVSI